MGLQEEKLNELRKNRTRVTIFTRNGARLTGIILGFDLHTVTLEGQGKQMCLFKHSITTVEYKK
ncbi:MAG: RNA chaperone Hfq [Caldibacillus sp.]